MIQIAQKPHTTISYHDAEVTMDKPYKVTIVKEVTTEQNKYSVVSGLDGEEKRIVEGFILNHLNKNGI